MKNIHVIPTDKPSRLYLTTKEYIFEEVNSVSTDECQNKHIYITSDEEIKVNDYITDGYKVWQWKDDSSLLGRKKVILSTDEDLITDCVQAIDVEFLEWFVKNPSCECVEVEKEYITPLGDIVKTCYDNERLNYKIIIPKTTQEIIDEDFSGGLDMGQIIPKEEIDRMNAQLSDSFEYKGRVIPKEEPKQDLEKEMFELEQELDIPSHLRWHNSKPKQETPEEAAKKKYPMFKGETYIGNNKKMLKRAAFIEGAKWQAEIMYSEEDMLFAYEQGARLALLSQSELARQKGKFPTSSEWFNQFKKK